jgi:hypothetical protein
MVDDGCIGGSALAVNRSYLATGSSEGVVNIYNLAAATSQPHPKPDKVRYIRYNLILDSGRGRSGSFRFQVPRTHDFFDIIISPVHSAFYLTFTEFMFNFLILYLGNF